MSEGMSVWFKSGSCTRERDGKSPDHELEIDNQWSNIRERDRDYNVRLDNNLNNQVDHDPTHHRFWTMMKKLRRTNEWE